MRIIVQTLLVPVLGFLASAGCREPETPINAVTEYVANTTVYDVLFLPGDDKCLVVSLDRLAILDVHDNEAVVQSSQLRGWLDNSYLGASYCETDDSIYVGKSEDGVVRFDVESMAGKTGAAPLPGSQFCERIPNSNSYVTILDRKVLARIDQETNEIEWQTRTRFDDVFSVRAISARWIALGEHADGLEGRVNLYDLETGKLYDFPIEHSKTIRGIAFSHDERFLASTGDDGFLRVWELSTGQLIWQQWNDRDGAFAVAVHPNGDYIAVGCMRGIKIWSLKSEELVASWNGHLGFVRSLKFSEDGNYLLSGSADYSAALWKTEDVIGQLRYRQDAPGGLR